MIIAVNFIAQLVEHRTGIAEVTGSNPVDAMIFWCDTVNFGKTKILVLYNSI